LKLEVEAAAQRNTTVTTDIKALQTSLALAAALLAASCSGTDDFSDGTPKDDSSGGAPAVEGEPVYALTSNVWGTDGAMGYLYTASSLSDGAPDLDHAIEFPGGAWLSGRDGDPYVYVSSADGGPTITRWEVLENGKLVEGPTISFESLGLTMGMRFATAPILSDTKAYLVDVEEHLIATWNPREMTIGAVIELEVEARDGLPAWIPTVVLRDDKLFLTVVWEEDWRFGDSSRVIAIDTTTDEVVNTSDDTRCEQLAVGSLASDGTAYYSPYAHAPAARLVLGPEYGTRSCSIRVVPSGAAFDDGWDVDLSALAGGRPAGEFILASDEVGFFRAFYNDEVGVTAENWQDKLGAPSYRWWRWELGADHAEEVPDQELTVEAAHYTVDGKTYVGNPSSDWSATTIVELDPSGEFREGITVRGTPGGVVRTH
jgi:hypothetical protein